MEIVLFAVLGVLAVAAGVAVFRVDSMARATVALLLSFVFVAGELLLLDLDYLGVLTVLMMTMEMAIMAVFMIMFMMNPAGLEPMEMVHNKRGALAIAAAVFAGLTAAALLVPWPAAYGPRAADPTRQLGEAVMGGHMLVMMVVGVALFATMIGATVLATARGRYGDAATPTHPTGHGGHGESHGGHGGHGHGGGHGTSHGGHGGDSG
ncbi:NADH:ubiquinone oxidoreductase subunit 6 (chain J) [Amycolatopsis arida]|uniref:NADH-quinone oxidoreductase subunit J n=1 Tax=Amycolatopsis arida TaxID=587909 RepID=A0A1I6ATW4_9PSEU|nr:NADH-quinone oxidoreductase subunit J [Amycolatopsis arida]TDX97520.1 NADH:ubiquinone oxidoreductase subunit 6 (subunit J) [Amycolatopsis arida]SFQ72122.1 NADH:ubiquinone oxidoreductase subunit 6 (chain J) [Amycolatopsis arida]